MRQYTLVDFFVEISSEADRRVRRHLIESINRSIELADCMEAFSVHMLADYDGKTIPELTIRELEQVARWLRAWEQSPEDENVVQFPGRAKNS